MNDSGLRIGITCYPTTGGSGNVATEIGLALARRGHNVHFVSYDVPWRLRAALGQERVVQLEKGSVGWHKVELLEYPLPQLGAYPLALASRLAEVSVAEELQLLHLHYAVPHAISGYLARQILDSAKGLGSSARRDGAPAPRTIVTLHGTDITLVGGDASLRPLNRFALLHSDGLTAPSEFLKRAAYESLGLPESTAIEVIPNFVDADHFRPAEPRPDRNGNGTTPATPRVLVHSSNFRPLKRIEDVIAILRGVREVMSAILLLIGDGPERPRIEQLVAEQGLQDAVHFLGMQMDFLTPLQHSDVFLLPSATEGFGLAALEALSCGVPVVASRVGGIPEVVRDGETGLLCEPGDVAAMTAAVLRLLQDPHLHRQMSLAARVSVEKHWQQEPLVIRYEDYYRRVLATPRKPSLVALPVN